MKLLDIFFQNIKLSGLLNDSSGLWLFGNLKEGSFVDAVRIGFMLGFYEGIDYGIHNIKGDPNLVTVRIEVLSKDGLYTYIDQGYTRKDFYCNSQGVHIKIAENIIIKQINDNNILWLIKDDEDRLIVDLRLDLHFYHKVPDIVLPNNFISMLISPMVRISGDIRVLGKKYPVEGIGAIDQYASKKIISASAKKYGYSFYEPIMWSDHISSVLYYLITSDGKAYLDDLLLVYDDKLEKLKIEHLQINAFTDYGGCLLPSNYSIKSSNEDFEFYYEAKTENRKKVLTWGYPKELINSWVPNLPVISAAGILSYRKTSMKKDLDVTGKGILEFLNVNKSIKKKDLIR